MFCLSGAINSNRFIPTHPDLTREALIDTAKSKAFITKTLKYVYINMITINLLEIINIYMYVYITLKHLTSRNLSFNVQICSNCCVSSNVLSKNVKDYYDLHQKVVKITNQKDSNKIESYLQVFANIFLDLSLQYIYVCDP